MQDMNIPDLKMKVKKFATTENNWNQLNQQTVGASGINAFKGRLSRRETRMGFFMD